MTKQNKNSNVKILEPITEEDFQSALELLHDNIFKDANYNIEYVQSLSLGEVLVAKANNEVVGALMHYRPGKIFNRLEDKHFDLKNINAMKKEIGYIEVLVVSKKNRRKGIGKALTAKAMEYQKDWGSKAVDVHCWQSSPNKGSEKLFTKLGFTSLKMHIAPWFEYSQRLKDKYHCVVCSNPCKCDDLEMVKYL